MNTDIVFRDVSRSFDGTPALEQVSFTAPAGAITGFVGRNGAGKSTALRILLGLTRPDSGTALIGERAAHSYPAGTLGVVVDSGAHPGMKVADHLRLRAERIGATDSILPRLDEVDLGRLARRRIGKLSLGQRQRVVLAAALLGSPQVLVLDEPMNGLDPDGVRWLGQHLRQAADAGATVLVSSHLLAELDELVDRVVVLSRTVRWSGSAAEMNKLGHPDLRSLYESVTEDERVAA